MKKEFNAPTMDIELFISEDILTESGQMPTKTAHQYAEDYLKDNNVKIIDAVIGTLNS